MPNIIKVENLNNPALDIFVRLTGAEVRRSIEGENGIFIAESPTVIEVALNAGYEPVSILTDERLINGAVRDILLRTEGIPVYTADRETLRTITGFELTRGALCAMKRKENRELSDVLSGAQRVAILEEIADSTNIGAIFRSAAALNIDAVLTTPTCCDPLCRRALRVSMGTVLQVPYTTIGKNHEDWVENGIDILHSFGFKTAAMALSDNSVSLDDAALKGEERLAIILGTEGTGLDKRTIEKSDYTVKIPMSHGVDSLNVGAAAAVAFWELRKR